MEKKKCGLSWLYPDLLQIYISGLSGTGEWTECYNSLKDFTKQREKYSQCKTKGCPDAGIKVPSIQFENSEFYGFSEFWYSMEDVLRMGGPYIHDKFVKAAIVSFFFFFHFVMYSPKPLV